VRIDAETQRGTAVTITVDGVPIETFLGETVAGAMLASGRRGWRHTAQGEVRGLFCGIGICFDCTVTVDGVRNVRACLTPVSDGLAVTTESSLERTL
jgi:predicted molibdopterin-dependent oxidoreductase YjgC